MREFKINLEHLNLVVSDILEIIEKEFPNDTKPERLSSLIATISAMLLYKSIRLIPWGIYSRHVEVGVSLVEDALLEFGKEKDV